MNKLEIVNLINDYSFTGNDEGIIELMNDLFSANQYKDYKELVFMMITMTQMYGFLSYLSNDEQDEFLSWDCLRSISYKGEKIPFYNSGQLSLLSELDNHKKVFFSAPTSFGKTNLVLEHIIMNNTRYSNILFVVPTNSLLEELYTKILNINKNIQINYRITTQPFFLDNENNFMILTPERFLLLNETNDVNKFDLIVMDETYKIVDGQNEHITDFLDSRALRFRKVADIIASTQNRLILISPFTYYLTNSMKRFLEKYNIYKIDRRIEYVKRKIHLIDDANRFKEYFHSKKIGYMKKCTIANKVNYILQELIDEQNIVYVKNYSVAYDIVSAIDWNVDKVQSSRFDKFLKHLEENYTIDDKNEWAIITALKKRVGIYIAPLPRYVKKEIIRLFEEKIIKTLIVTTAFTEGVNSNASNLIFTSLISGSNSNKLSNIDVLNVMGRAGRFAQKSVGRIFCISEEIYNRINDLQKDSMIKLENYNYYDKKNENHVDYEVDMMQEEFLSTEDLKKKEELSLIVQRLGLSQSELNISLNVPTKWKLALFEYFNNHSEILQQAYNSSINLLNEASNKREQSLFFIFNTLKDCFAEMGINGFSCKPYEIKAFDNKGDFIWGRLYSIYSAGSISKIIFRNMKYISKKFNEIINELSLGGCKTIDEINEQFNSVGNGWILKYYKKDLSHDINSFYSETFKFISSIIQYKIPFYVSFFISILKLYISKKNYTDLFNTNQLDAKKVTLLFEDGSIYDDYSNLIDYGLSNDIVMKLYVNKVTMNQVLNSDYNEAILDEYERILMDDYLKIMK